MNITEARACVRELLGPAAGVAISSHPNVLGGATRHHATATLQRLRSDLDAVTRSMELRARALLDADATYRRLRVTAAALHKRLHHQRDNLLHWPVEVCATLGGADRFTGKGDTLAEAVADLAAQVRPHPELPAGEQYATARTDGGPDAQPCR